MATSENPYAGQGPVLLDIGDDVGALVVRMPPDTEGLEVEIRPVGERHHDHPDGHHHVGPHVHPHVHPHVAVVARPGRAGVAYTLVYPAVGQGEHDLAPLPDGEVVMTVTVEGGRVTRASWPGTT